ncbi:BQ5605_C005g03427 [Microbotryum silenes-dioicae]|uniref:BQ5605_C005g03427 protein n=1 Tax=Microbotryum silenes-dioicae TaxID=796604 RepID=A0A2X0PCT4_9BASI|nr:BQ5605_C005g03427 [Microbotryum silenes-dioicae]
MGPKTNTNNNTHTNNNTNTNIKAKAKTKPKLVPKSSTGPVAQSQRSAQPTNARTTPSRLKVVVRRLPPALPEAVFWSSVAPWVTVPPDSTAPSVSTQPSSGGVSSVDWIQYRSGKVRARHDKGDTHSRAYLSFKTPEALVAFHRAYDGWNFKSKAGQVTRAVVEFAPYQNTPSRSNKRDPRQGTIEQDPDFIAFQDALASPDLPPVEQPAQKATARATNKGKGSVPPQGPPPSRPSKRLKKGSDKGGKPVVVPANASATHPSDKTAQRKSARKSVATERGGSKSSLQSARGLTQKGKAKIAEADNQAIAKQSRQEAPPTQAADAADLVRRTLQIEYQAKNQSSALAKPSPSRKNDTRSPKEQSTRSVPQILKNPERKPVFPVSAPAVAPAASSSAPRPSPMPSVGSLPPSVQVSSGSSSRGARKNRGTSRAGWPRTPADTRPVGTSAPLSEQTPRLGSRQSQPGTSSVEAQSGNSSGQSSSRGGGGGRGRGRGRGRGECAGAGAARGGRLHENAPHSRKLTQNTQAGAKPVIATTTT